MSYPRRQAVQVRSRVQTGVDRNGDPKMGFSPWKAILVFGWAVSPTQEVVGDSLLRTIDTLTMYPAPEDDPGPGGEIMIPGDPVPWRVEGNNDDYSNNPYFVPGLVVVTAHRVKG